MVSKVGILLPWYIDRVESKSNVSDEPSRAIFDQTLAKLGSVWCDPVLAYLDEPAPCRDPSMWFGDVHKWERIIAELHCNVFPTSPNPSSSGGQVSERPLV